MHKTKQLGITILAAVLGTAAGCDSGPEMYEVTGSVSYDGVLVEKGEISFIATTPDSTPDGGLIENGVYSFPASPGAKRVEIRGSRQVPADRQTNPEMGPMYEDFIPKAYNRESTLTAEVTADGENVFDFSLMPPKP